MQSTEKTLVFLLEWLTEPRLKRVISTGQPFLFTGEEVIYSSNNYLHGWAMIGTLPNERFMYNNNTTKGAVFGQWFLSQFITRHIPDIRWTCKNQTPKIRRQQQQVRAAQLNAPALKTRRETSVMGMSHRKSFNHCWQLYKKDFGGGSDSVSFKTIQERISKNKHKVETRNWKTRNWKTGSQLQLQEFSSQQAKHNPGKSCLRTQVHFQKAGSICGTSAAGLLGRFSAVCLLDQTVH